LPSEKCEVSSLGLGLELPGLSLGFYDKVSVLVSSWNLSQVSVLEVTVSTTSLLVSTKQSEHTKRMQMHLQNVVHLQKQPVLTTASLAPCVYLQDFSKQVASWSYGLSTGLVHVKTSAVFNTYCMCSTWLKPCSVIYVMGRGEQPLLWK